MHGTDSEFERKIFATFMRDGRIVQLPARQKKRMVLLVWLADHFRPGQRYTEAQVSELLSRYYDDYATLLPAPRQPRADAAETRPLLAGRDHAFPGLSGVRAGSYFGLMSPMDKDELPSTLKKSPPEAQETYMKVHDSAVETYGEGERAHRTAYSALKHSFEKVGDRWEPKKHKGPSDPRAKRGADEARKGEGETFGGVDYYGHSKEELMERARELGVRGRSQMNKSELARAIASKQR